MIYFVVQLANIFKVRYYIIAKHNLLNSGVKPRGVQILSIWLPGWLHFAQQCLIFSTQLSQFLPLHTKISISSYAKSTMCPLTVRITGHSRPMGPQYGTCFIPPFRHVECGCGSYISETFMYTLIILYHLGLEDFKSPCTIQPVNGFRNRSNSIIIKHI